TTVLGVEGRSHQSQKAHPIPRDAQPLRRARRRLLRRRSRFVGRPDCRRLVPRGEVDPDLHRRPRHHLPRRGGPLAAAKLGRIGQECDPPSIKNVIEWRRPEWASSLPFGGGGGGESDRVLQKVCCEGSATPEKPNEVDLKILGLEVTGALLGGPAAWFERNPVQLRGPLRALFGKFEILYLDDDMRITETYQGYFAVNVREESEWF
ncbi:hypothetical protein ACHAWF_015861, partial [Thalassiosira exigua]